MATQAFKDWVKDGRPFKLAQPIEDYRKALVAYGWPSSELGTIGDEDHLQAEVPQDHCPFSFTGWPLPNEYPYVHALDVMHKPANGQDVAPLAAYWIDEAKAGRTPWVKYINWRGQQYDVRHNWEARPIGGHFDHAHISYRTDWTHKGIGDWNPTKGSTPVTTSATGRDVWAETIDAQSEDYRQPAAEFLKWTVTNNRILVRLETAVEALQTAVDALSGGAGSPVNPQELADALAGSEAFVDALAAAIVAKSTPRTIAERLANVKELLTALGTEG